MAGGTIGTVFVAVVPSTAGFGAAAKAGLVRESKSLGAASAAAMAAGARGARKGKPTLASEAFLGNPTRQKATQAAAGRHGARNAREMDRGARAARRGKPTIAAEQFLGTKAQQSRTAKTAQRHGSRVSQAMAAGAGQGGGGRNRVAEAAAGGGSDSNRAKSAAKGVFGGNSLFSREAGRQMSNAGRRMTMSGSAFAAAGLIAAGYFSAKFASSIQRVGSVLGDDVFGNQAQMTRLADTAKQVAATNPFTATDTAKAMEELARGGLKYEQVLAAIGPSSDIAIAGQMDLATSAHIASAAINTFGLSASEIPMIGDSLAKAANISNAEISDLGLALTYVGPVAAGAGLSLTETAAGLAALGKQGIIGSKAGTSMRSALMSLQSPTEANAALMEKYGISVQNANGELKSLPQIAQSVTNGLKKTRTEAEKIDVLNRLFGKYGSSFGRILGGQTGKGIDYFIDQLKGAQGEAKKLAAQALSPLERSFIELKGAAENFAIEFGDAIAPALQTLATSLKSFSEFMGSLPDGVKQGLAVGLTGLAVAGPLLWITGGTIAAAGAIKAALIGGGAVAAGQIRAAMMGGLAPGKGGLIGMAGRFAASAFGALAVPVLIGVAAPAFANNVGTMLAEWLVGEEKARQGLNGVQPSTGGSESNPVPGRIGRASELSDWAQTNLAVAALNDALEQTVTLVQAYQAAAQADQAIRDSVAMLKSAGAIGKYNQAVAQGENLIQQRNSVMRQGAGLTLQEISNFKAQAAAGREMLRTSRQQGASTQYLTAQAKSMAGNYLRQANAMGLNRNQAINLARAYKLIPKSVLTQIKTTGDAPAKKQIGQINSQLDKIDKAKTEVKVMQKKGQMSPEAAKANLEKLNNAAKQLKAKKIELKARVSGGNKAANQLKSLTKEADKKTVKEIKAEAKVQQANQDIDNLVKNANKISDTDPKIDVSSDIVPEVATIRSNASAIDGTTLSTAYIDIITRYTSQGSPGGGGGGTPPPDNGGEGGGEEGRAAVGAQSLGGEGVSSFAAASTFARFAAASTFASNNNGGGGGKGGKPNLGNLEGLLKYIQDFGKRLGKLGGDSITKGMDTIVEAIRAGDWGEKAKKEIDKNWPKVQEAARRILTRLQDLRSQMVSDISGSARDPRWLGRDTDAAGLKDSWQSFSDTIDLVGQKANKEQKARLRKVRKAYRATFQDHYTRLAELETADEYRINLKDAAQTSFDLSSARSPGSLISKLNKQAKALQTFRTNIDVLAKAGMPPAFLQQLLQADPITGSRLAAKLAASGTDLEAVKAAWSSYYQAGSDLSSYGTETVFGGRIGTAFKDGMGAEMDEIGKDMDALGLRIAESFKAALGFGDWNKSPAAKRLKQQARARNEGASVPGVRNPGRRGAGNNGGGRNDDRVTVNVHAGANESAVDLARKTGRELSWKQKKRRNRR